MHANYDSVVKQLTSAGLIIRGNLRFGSIVRCGVKGDREKRAWYSLHGIITDAGDSLIVGSYGIWRGNDSGSRKIDLDKSSKLTDQQRESLRKRLADDRRAAERQRAAEAKRAAARAEAIWSRLSIEGESAYLRRKGVLGHGVRYSAKGAIAIPMQDASGSIHGLEIIRDKASADQQRKPAKEFWPKGCVKKGHFFLIGAPSWIILIAEGYATAAALYEATGHPVAVAFDAGNLAAVATALSARYRGCKFLICADDDALARCEPCGEPVFLADHPAECPHCHQPHKRKNTGIVDASAAALAVSGAWVKPVFADEDGRRSTFAARGIKRTDFNDIATVESAAVVRAQIDARLAELRWSPRTWAAQAIPTTGGEGQEPLKPIASLQHLLDRFSLVYGMGGVTFDAQEHQLVSLSDMRDACTHRELHRAWHEHPDRTIVRIKEVGFDPTERDPDIRCNLWSGWPTAPKSGSCERLLELLRYMCSGDKHASGLYEFVLKWLAYPLQHHGAKMKTTIVLHGPQGAGKNLFFEAYMSLYGHYGTVIGQDAIEDKFNDWASKKLFLIADEVVARSDLYHVKNRLKSFITGDVIRINTKNVGAYAERNHVNLVFLSNEMMPVVLEEDDRRHCVIYTPEKLDREVYKAVIAELENGGAQALHHYLLHLPMGDFDNATLPPQSDAKKELINQSMDSTSRFWYALEAGELIPGKLGPALSTDVYQLYHAYCRRYGIKAAPLPRLVNVLKRKHGATEDRKRYTANFDTKGPHGFLFLGDLEQPLEQREADWLGERVTAFRTAMRDYIGEATHG